MNCIGCKKELGIRPKNVLIQHKAEGIQVLAICGELDCWIKLGTKMAEGMR